MLPNNSTNANKQSLQPKDPRVIHKAWNLRISHRHSEHTHRLYLPIDQILQSLEEAVSRHL
jgi:hypothetical protein